jgi:hypothetical protein
VAKGDKILLKNIEALPKKTNKFLLIKMFRFTWLLLVNFTAMAILKLVEVEK